MNFYLNLPLISFSTLLICKKFITLTFFYFIFLVLFSFVKKKKDHFLNNHFSRRIFISNLIAFTLKLSKAINTIFLATHSKKAHYNEDIVGVKIFSIWAIVDCYLWQSTIAQIL